MSPQIHAPLGVVGGFHSQVEAVALQIVELVDVDAVAVVGDHVKQEKAL
jgi:hypothetical protein